MLAYLAFTLVVGLFASRKQDSDDEYFLARRQLPAWAVGLSILATLLSSLTYLSEPGEVWKSGVMNALGKLMAIPIEMTIVWLYIIPFLMRFRFTSAYEYLEYRYNYTARLQGVTLFTLMSIAWMGFVVLAVSRAISHVTGVPLWIVVSTVGFVSTIYTVMGGMRAVVWTDVAQIVLMLGGGLICVGFVVLKTGTGPVQWYAAVQAQRTAAGTGLQFFSLDPFTRSSVVTVGISMLVWHLCTHSGSQMTVQRYFSTSNLQAARQAFVWASLTGVAVNLLLLFTGMALVYFYTSGAGQMPADIDPLGRTKGAYNADYLLPSFMVNYLPAGLAGGVLSAILAAAMSSIDSGINSLSAVICVERTRREPRSRFSPQADEPVDPANMLVSARWLTLIIGVAITLVAMGLDGVSASRNIVEMMPRTFNCFTAPLGGLFLIGIFLPFVTGRAIVPATILGLLTSMSLAFAKEWFHLEHDVSPMWVMPTSLWVMTLAAVLFSWFDHPSPETTFGLTWFTRRQEVLMDLPLDKDFQDS